APLACAQVTSSKVVVGTGSMAGCSSVWNSSNGAVRVVPWSRGPATRRHHRSAPVLISSKLPNVRPVQKLSRTKGTCRSTRGLSFGFADLAGSIKQPKMMGQLGVAAVEQRIVQVRVQHTAFEIVQDDSARG